MEKHPMASAKTAKRVASQTSTQSKKAPPPVQEEEVVEEKKKRQKREVTKETLMKKFEELLEDNKTEMEKLRNAADKPKGLKYLRHINKIIKVMFADYKKVLKIKKKTNRTQNANSGIMKEVGITPELAGFLNVDPAKKMSRVDVTKSLCAYIREHNLQQPDCRKNLLLDEPMSKLLDYEHDPEDPMTYFKMQKYIQKHFIKEPPAPKKKAAPKKSKEVKDNKEQKEVESAPATVQKKSVVTKASVSQSTQPKSSPATQSNSSTSTATTTTSSASVVASSQPSQSTTATSSQPVVKKKISVKKIVKKPEPPSKTKAEVEDVEQLVDD